MIPQKKKDKGCILCSSNEHLSALTHDKYGSSRVEKDDGKPKWKPVVWIPYEQLGLAYSDSILSEKYRDLGRPQARDA